MDKWDEYINRIQQAILAEEPEAATTGGLQMLAEFGRTVEMLGADLDRIATALEARNPAAERVAEQQAELTGRDTVHDL